MLKMSVIEFEELGKAIGTHVRETMEGLKPTEEQIQKIVDSQVRDIMKKTAVRKAPWGDSFQTEMSPIDVFQIQKVLDEPAGEDEVKKRLQDFNDNLYILTAVLKVAPEKLNSYKSFVTEWSELAKALNTATAGAGLEWIPTGFSSKLIEMVEIEAKVGNLFQSFSMPTNPYTYPLLLSDGEAYKGVEPKTGSPSMHRSSSPTTDDLTFTAVPLIANYPASDFMTEDSIVPIMSTFRRSIARAIAKGRDNAIINGDLTTTHLDTGYTVADYDNRRCWNGLRDQCQSSMKNDWSSWSTTAGLALIRAMVAEMGIYGLEPDDLEILCNANMYGKIRALAEVATVEKAGAAVATINKGKLESVDGIHITKTAHVEERQNASGVYDGSTVTYTQCLLVYKPGFMTGIRSGVTLEYHRNPLTSMNYLIATSRMHWKPIYDVTTEKMIGWAYNDLLA